MAVRTTQDATPQSMPEGWEEGLHFASLALRWPSLPPRASGSPPPLREARLALALSGGGRPSPLVPLTSPRALGTLIWAACSCTLPGRSPGPSSGTRLNEETTVRGGRLRRSRCRGAWSLLSYEPRARYRIRWGLSVRLDSDGFHERSASPKRSSVVKREHERERG